MLLLIYLFTCKTPVNLACVYLKQKISRKSIQNWYGLLRDVMTRKLIQNGIQLGEPNCIVELDKTAIGHKHKYNRGFFRGGRVKWILGILDISTKKCVLHWVPNRSWNELFLIIDRFVIKGSIVHSDEFPSYSNLKQSGYIHKTVNHSENWVNPLDGTHTNNIENFWSHLKSHLRTMHGVYTELLPSYLDKYMYRWNRKFDGPLFELFLQDISDLYRF